MSDALDSSDSRLWHPAAAVDSQAASLPSARGQAGPVPRRPYFEERAWGASLANHVYGLPERVQAHLRVLPEGMLMHADCGRCSARHEVALDFRPLDGGDDDPDGAPVDLYAFGAERARWLQLGLWQDDVRAWSEAHEECRVRRGAPEPEARVAAVIEAVRATSAFELAARGTASPVVVVVPEEGPSLWFDVTGTRRYDRMLTAFRVREVVRWWRRPPAAVLAAEEVPARERTTLFRVALLTAAATWVAHATVDRFGRPYPGPGRLGALAWSPVREAAVWLDGLLAKRMPFPVPRVLSPMEG